MKKLKERYIGFSTYLGGFLLLAVVVVICIQIVTRRVGISASWTDELARYMFVLLCFLVWPAVILKGDDIVISFLFDRLPPRIRRVTLGLMHFVMAAVLALLFYSILRNIKNVGNVIWTTIRWMKLSWVFTLVAVGILCAFFANIVRGIEILAGRVHVLTDEERSLQEIEAAQEEVLREFADEGLESKKYTARKEDDNV